MSNERFYTVNPIDVEGPDFTIEGLQAALDRIHATWGGKLHKATTVSPALSLGSGAAIVAVENGRVMLVRDDAARALAKAREAAEQEPDGRTKTFYAKATIVRVTGPNRAEPFSEQPIEGEGLAGLVFNAAMYVQEQLGDVPDCMSYEAFAAREASIRAQISRAKTQERDSTFVNFPGSQTANFFEVGKRPNEYYRLTLSVFTARPANEEQAALAAFPELPRRD